MSPRNRFNDASRLTKILQNLRDNPAFAFRSQSLLLAVVQVGHLGVIKAKLVQQRRLEIIRVDDVFDCLVAELVSFTEGHTRLDASASEPGRKALAIVVSAAGCGISLRHWQASNLAPPMDDRAVEQSSSLQVCDKRSGGLVGPLTDCRQRGADAGVSIPRLTAQKELHETDTALDEPSCDQTARAVLTSFIAIEPVELVCLSGLLSDIKSLFRFSLHPCSEFIRLNACFQIRLTRVQFEMSAVQRSQQIEVLRLQRSLEMRRRIEV